MKHLIFICLLFVFAFGMNAESFAQEDQAGGLGIGLQGLRGDAMYPQQTNPAVLKKNRRAESARILSGVRRLVPQEYATIQAAIDSSADGDTVLVSDGTYVENIRFHGKAIVVASLFLVDDDTSHIEQTIIDGSNPLHPDSASAVYFIDGEDTTSVLCGFTITGGAGTLWTNQVIWRSGGGVFCVGASGTTIIDNHITGNRVSGENTSGGGVEFFSDQGVVIIERNHIYDNRVTTTPNHGFGGGVDIWGDDVFARIVDNAFERDTVVAQGYALGGAVFIQGLASPAGGMIRGNVFRENIADATSNNGLGGAIFTLNTSTMEIRDNLFESNIAKSTNAYSEGGALLIDDEPPASGYGRKVVAGNWFINNLSSSQGVNSTGGGLELFRTLATVSGNYFKQNATEGGASLGGAIRIFSSAFRLENNIYAENTAFFGGAVHIAGTPQSGADLDIINNTVVNNTALSLGGGICVDGVQAIVLNSIVWGNTNLQLAPIGGGSIEVRHSDVQGGWPGDGNMDADPLLDADSLTNASPCIGKGTDVYDFGGGIILFCPLEDISGRARPYPNPSVPDMGAWESKLGTPVGIEPKPGSGIPQAYALDQSYPNPFNPTATIEFSLPQSANVKLTIYNSLGQKVRTLLNERTEPGVYQTVWDGKNDLGVKVGSGVYLYRMVAGDFIQTRKMILMK